MSREIGFCHELFLFWMQSVVLWGMLCLGQHWLLSSSRRKNWSKLVCHHSQWVRSLGLIQINSGWNVPVRPSGPQRGAMPSDQIRRWAANPRWAEQDEASQSLRDQRGEELVLAAFWQRLVSIFSLFTGVPVGKQSLRAQREAPNSKHQKTVPEIRGDNFGIW